MRLHNWPQRLAEAVTAANEKTFGYGLHDCCLFTADVVQAITGVDYAESLRGYTSEQEAYEIVEHYGSITAMVSALLGAEPIHPAHAMRGDVVLAEYGGRETLGICLGAHCAFAQVGVGLRMLPRASASRAWSVR